MALAHVTRALLDSYANEGGINHLDGTNLPAEDSVNRLAAECMHLLFPGYFDPEPVTKASIAALTARRVDALHQHLAGEIEKCLRHTRVPDAATRAPALACELLEQFPDLRRILHTDVHAAYLGDPAARSTEEIILAYPCVLVIALQRVAHRMLRLGVPLLPRMLTEYAHERTGCDLHPGAQIGEHFFIDHCTGVVVGETARLGDHVKIYQGVTLGAKSFEVDDDGNPVKGVKRHPDIGDHVTIYAHATILGGDTVIGANSIVGANVWLINSVPPNSIAYYKGEGLVVRTRKAREECLDQLGSGDWQI